MPPCIIAKCLAVVCLIYVIILKFKTLVVYAKIAYNLGIVAKCMHNHCAEESMATVVSHTGILNQSLLLHLDLYNIPRSQSDIKYSSALENCKYHSKVYILVPIFCVVSNEIHKFISVVVSGQLVWSYQLTVY